MNIRSRRVALIALTLIVSMLFASISYANENIKDYMSLSEAKEYLLSYEKVTIVEGREIVTTYEFADEKSLDKAATYISENGLNAFNSMLDEGIRKQVATEQRNAPILRTTTPSTGHAQVSKNNGTYHVKSNVSVFFLFLLCVYRCLACMSMYHMHQCPQKPEEDVGYVGFPGSAAEKCSGLGGLAVPADDIQPGGHGLRGGAVPGPLQGFGQYSHRPGHLFQPGGPDEPCPAGPAAKSDVDTAFADHSAGGHRHRQRDLFVAEHLPFYRGVRWM